MRSARGMNFTILPLDVYQNESPKILHEKTITKKPQKITKKPQKIKNETWMSDGTTGYVKEQVDLYFRSVLNSLTRDEIEEIMSSFINLWNKWNQYQQRYRSCDSGIEILWRSSSSDLAYCVRAVWIWAQWSDMNSNNSIKWASNRMNSKSVEQNEFIEIDWARDEQ